MHFWVTNQDWDISLPLVILQSAASEFLASDILRRLFITGLDCAFTTFRSRFSCRAHTSISLSSHVTIHSPLLLWSEKKLWFSGEALILGTFDGLCVFVTDGGAFWLRAGIVRYSLSLTMFSLSLVWWQQARLQHPSFDGTATHAQRHAKATATSDPRTHNVEYWHVSLQPPALLYSTGTWLCTNAGLSYTVLRLVSGRRTTRASTCIRFLCLFRI
ncbi:hypothetical protein K458DRAFT_35639 [Lentithecium fluviatile CBS 122367]|uniref:Uncharacterized protein n=1 Tax=Lentithecium fluviatile CBS 122367 TaxID=1168545 RepID=A0A6G1J1E4_9PLEO|nr:hypothetical protein K458DRAFT_35639 [Lentithecium fluviatile CBS 122367]